MQSLIAPDTCHAPDNDDADDGDDEVAHVRFLSQYNYFRRWLGGCGTCVLCN